ncbi:disease resistance protein RGA2 [Trifolium repens]|nr:disease resistance protein RGA2 [Trifolium repens]
MLSSSSHNFQNSPCKTSIHSLSSLLLCNMPPIVLIASGTPQHFFAIFSPIDSRVWFTLLDSSPYVMMFFNKHQDSFGVKPFTI